MALKLSDLQQNEYEFTDESKASPASTGSFIKGIGKGLLKSVGETALGVGQIGRKIQKGVSGVSGLQTGEESIFDPEQAQKIRETTLKAEAPGEGTGKFIGTAAQFLAPTSQITRGQQILGKAAELAPKGTQLLAKGVARFLPEAIGTGTVSAVRSGGDIEQAKEEGALAGAFSVGLGSLGGIARSTYFPLLNESINKALGIQGKKSGGVALQETAKKTAGLQIIKDNADNVTVTLDDGTKAKFDPNKATYNTTLQAWNEVRKKIYSDYSSLAKKAGEKAVVDLSDVRQQVASALEAPILSVEKNAVRSILNDFDEIFKNPKEVDLEMAERFLKSLNDNTANGFFQGTTDAAASKVNAGTSRIIREKMDDVIEEATGENYQALRSQYSALKSLEGDLVRKFQQDARSIGGGIPEYMGGFAGADLISSALTLDAQGFAKGATLGTFAALKRKLSDPERFLKRSFNLIDNEVPSDLSLRLFGGTKPLTIKEENMVENVAESIKNPSIGMSIKSTVTPEKIAKSLTLEEYRTINEYLLNPADKKFFPKAQNLIEKFDINNASDDVQMKFLREVKDEYDSNLNKSL